MPPPTASDPWLASRRFGIVIDAGSSGSRLQIYSWKDPTVALLDGGEAAVDALPKVEKGAREGEEWVTKVEPGLSSFAENTDDVPAYLAPLLDHARNQVPPSLQADTPLVLLATAGMRLLTQAQQGAVLYSTCQFLRLHSHFRIDAPSTTGPCGASVRIISGEEEGLFGWIAVNYLMDGFTGGADRTTYGFLDMGGASTQIAFEPGAAEQAQTPEGLHDVRLRLLGGAEIRHRVFVTTWLGYGTNQARERYVGQAITAYERGRAHPDEDQDAADELVPDPCLPRGLQLTEAPVHTAPASGHAQQAHTLRGTGSFEQCMADTAPLLNKHAPCPDTPCLFNGVHVPPIDFGVSRFIGVSEYWYSSEHVFGLGGPYDYVQYERAASAFCARPWAGIVAEHEASRAQGHGHVGGDGEVLQSGQVVSTGRWGSEVELARLQMQCFKAAWVANVLHEGIGLPRLVDPGGNATLVGEGGDGVAEQADRKGLGRPAFQSVDTVGDIAISWTLGKMVLEASKGVTPRAKGDAPLADPMEDIHSPSSEDLVTPYLPDARPPLIGFDAIEGHLGHRLPSSLTRESLGFSFIGVVFYLVACFCIVLVAYRLRSLCRPVLRRAARTLSARNRKDRALEEGISLNGGPPRNPTLRPQKLYAQFRRMFSASHRSRPMPLASTAPRPALRQAQSSPTLRSPTRAWSLPAQNGFAQHPGMASSTQYISRASSPSPSLGSFADEQQLANSVSSLSSISRSRNSSHVNLSTLVPRQAPLSRNNSSLHMPNGGSFHDE